MDTTARGAFHCTVASTARPSMLASPNAGLHGKARRSCARTTALLEVVALGPRGFGPPYFSCGRLRGIAPAGVGLTPNEVVSLVCRCLEGAVAGYDQGNWFPVAPKQTTAW